MTDLSELFRRNAAQFGARVDAVPDDAWHAPTPCADWDVHDLVNHVVNEQRWAPDLMVWGPPSFSRAHVSRESRETDGVPVWTEGPWFRGPPRSVHLPSSPPEGRLEIVVSTESVNFEQFIPRPVGTCGIRSRRCEYSAVTRKDGDPDVSPGLWITCLLRLPTGTSPT